MGDQKVPGLAEKVARDLGDWLMGDRKIPGLVEKMARDLGIGQDVDRMSITQHYPRGGQRAGIGQEVSKGPQERTPSLVLAS